MTNENADTYVRWERTEEPGEDPTYTSQCGMVVEVWSKSGSEFMAWVNPGHIKDENSTYQRRYVGIFPTKLVAQKAVQKAFETTNALTWEYDAPEREIKKRVRKESASEVIGEQSTHPSPVCT